MMALGSMLGKTIGGSVQDVLESAKTNQITGTPATTTVHARTDSKSVAMGQGDSKAANTLGNITRDQWQHYLQQFGGLEQQLVDSRNDQSLVDSAATAAVKQARIGRESTARDISRYGLGMTGAQANMLARTQQLGDATNTAQSMNTARIDQRDRNMTVMADLMMKGRGVASSGIDGLGDAASTEASRNAQNAQAKAADKAQKTSTAIGIVGLGLMAF